MPKSETELPLLCGRCLGQREQIRMVRDSRGDTCRLCTRPYATFRWKLQGMTKRTTICPSCARTKNICQACTRDLTIGVPVAVRDAALNKTLTAGQTATAARFKAIQQEKHATNRATDLLAQLAEPPQQKQIEQKPPKSNLKKTVVALPFNGSPLDQRPDQAVWLFVAGLEPGFNIDKLRSALKGSIAHLHDFNEARFALVEFSSTEAAAAAEKTPTVIDGTRLSYRWSLEAPELKIDKSLYPKLALVVRKFVKTGIPPL